MGGCNSRRIYKGREERRGPKSGAELEQNTEVGQLEMNKHMGRRDKVTMSGCGGET